MPKAKNIQAGSLTVSREDGSSYAVPIFAPGAAVRFVVGTPSAHATVWRLWTTKDTIDLYLTTRSRVPDDSKYSFHATGDWRLQYDRDRARELGVRRIVSQWERPLPSDAGFVEVIRIVTPSDDIVTNSEPEPEAAKIEWIPQSPAGTALILHIVILPAGTVPKAPSNADVVSVLAMHDGSFAIVLVAVSDIPADLLIAFQEARTSVALNPPPGAPTTYVPRSDPEYRSISDAHTETGERFIWDLLM